MRNYKAETEWDAAKYKRLTFKIDRDKWDKLTQEQQAELKHKVQIILTTYLNRP